MKVWLSAAEVEQFIGGVDDTDRRIAFGLAFRSGLRVGARVYCDALDCPYCGGADAEK